MTPAFVPARLPIFQSDQCFNDRRIREACNAGGLVHLYGFPRRLMGKKDPEVIADLIPRGNPLVTADKALPGEHSGVIPTRHPGIVVICFSNEVCNKTLRTSDITRILQSFKEMVVNWPHLPIQNSILFIMESRIEVRCSSSIPHFHAAILRISRCER